MLLFQWRVGARDDCGARRICERRLINLTAPSPRAAAAAAQRAGRAAQFRGRTTAGHPLAFEFVGLTEIMELGFECQPDEVWYDVVNMLRPMERRADLVLDDTSLAAFLRGDRSWARAGSRPRATRTSRPRQAGA